MKLPNIWLFSWYVVDMNFKTQTYKIWRHFLPSRFDVQNKIFKVLDTSMEIQNSSVWHVCESICFDFAKNNQKWPFFRRPCLKIFRSCRGFEVFEVGLWKSSWKDVCRKRSDSFDTSCFSAGQGGKMVADSSSIPTSKKSEYRVFKPYSEPQPISNVKSTTYNEQLISLCQTMGS